MSELEVKQKLATLTEPEKGTNVVSMETDVQEEPIHVTNEVGLYADQ